MTNAQIIFNHSIELAKAGTIGTTGRIITITYQNEEGENVTEKINEPEAIHTYAVWKQQGRQVKKGQKAKAEIMIWKHTTKTIEAQAEDQEPEEIERMFMKKAFFFTIDQTEAITR